MHKAYFIMRRDLDLSAAKLAVQLGHGVDWLWSGQGSQAETFSAWRDPARGNRRKILLEVKSLAQLETVEKKLAEAGLACARIVDAGYTEVAPDTVTGLVVFPVEQLPASLKRLRLWQD